MLFQLSDIEDGAFEFLALAETMNQAAGDGVSALLMVEAILRYVHPCELSVFAAKGS